MRDLKNFVCFSKNKKKRRRRNEIFLKMFFEKAATKQVSYSLSAAFGITLGTTDSKNIHSSSISTEETAIVIAISINPTNESFRCP